MARYIRFTQWYRRSGYEPMLKPGEVLWGMLDEFRDYTFIAVHDAVGKAVADGVQPEHRRSRWAYDHHDIFTIVEEDGLPAEVWAAICADQLLGEP